MLPFEVNDINNIASTMYIDLLKNSLLDQVHQPNQLVAEGRVWRREDVGRALTMVGMPRLTNIEQCLKAIITDGVEGDCMETGVWRGGCCILMKGILECLGESHRKVILADSFCGLPEPDPKYEADKNSNFHNFDLSYLSSLEEVRYSFEKYGLLDDNVVFLEGWFKETLQHTPTKKLALLRLDGDMYESTILALELLYDRIQPGGYIIIDDYPVIGNCKQAIDEFRESRGIECTMEVADPKTCGVYWRIPH
jgi:O-methyltransferase